MNYDIEQVLIEAKELLKDEMSQISHKTWIEPLKIASIVDNNVTLVSEDSFKRDMADTKFHDLIMNTFSVILQKNCTLSIICKDEISVVEDKKIEVENISNNNQYIGTSLNPKYKFSTFVVGDNNRFAHAASLAVAEAPGTAYNPLFLYGGVGLGKTHLMHAIGNEVLFNNRNAKILYVTSERFTNEFIDALKNANTEKFRQKYRNIDVLLIDDIQFIAGKDSTQEEFFHTFNELRESGKQIVLSSDKPPKDISLLEERLKTRFEWGLLADVSMADYETRLAILRKKREENHIIIDDEILSDIALKIDSNIRELEGVFNKLIAQASLTHTPITMEMAEKAINAVILQKASVISVEYIQEIICKYFNITIKDLKSSQRSNDIAFPRQVGMYLCRILTNESYPKIGEAFGKRDHTTVMHAYKKIEQDIKQNPESNTKLIVDSVKKIILSKE
ncbi:MAG: chromosomal replication initiator protein DnaA [Clostridia bacterium]|nr:chromosomal replication initiator protein DnaA [Clostridia bacterium]